jgi:hypothetical protein
MLIVGAFVDEEPVLVLDETGDEELVEEAELVEEEVCESTCWTVCRIVFRLPVV